MKNVISLASNEAVDDIRSSASALRFNVAIIRDQLQRAISSTGKARKLESCLFRYSKFLGYWHAFKSGIYLDLRLLDRVQSSPHHRSRVDAIFILYEAIGAELAGPHPFISLPNEKDTRYNVRRVLDLVAEHLDEIDRQACEILGGQND